MNQVSMQPGEGLRYARTMFGSQSTIPTIGIVRLLQQHLQHADH